MTSTAHEDQFLPHPDDVAQTSIEGVKLPLLPEAFMSTSEFPGGVYSSSEMQEYGRDCYEAGKSVAAEARAELKACREAFDFVIRQCTKSVDVDGRAVVGTPRYKAWLHLRTHGQWPDDIPEWAKDHNGHMNDMVAARAVIEELAVAALAATKGESNE